MKPPQRSDYVSVNGNLSIVPGLAAATFNVAIQGDTAIEANESFLLYLSNLTNATLLLYNAARCTITNDDGGDYQVHTFAWNTIYTPKRTNEPFTATITARVASNRTAICIQCNRYPPRGASRWSCQQYDAYE